MQSIVNLLISAFNAIIAGLGAVATSLLAVLPESPFINPVMPESELIQAITWIIPVGSIALHLAAYVAAVLVYYSIRTMMRWAKVAGD